jgi:AbrB family looped-hinge helix DNA binding protein
MPSQSVRVSETGRLSLPADMRRKLGLEKGGVVQLEIVDGDLRIRTMKAVIERVQKMARESGWAQKTSVADFIAERRENARLEEEKWARLDRRD